MLAAVTGVFGGVTPTCVKVTHEPVVQERVRVHGLVAVGVHGCGHVYVTVAGHVCIAPGGFRVIAGFVGLGGPGKAHDPEIKQMHTKIL